MGRRKGVFARFVERLTKGRRGNAGQSAKRERRLFVEAMEERRLLSVGVTGLFDPNLTNGTSPGGSATVSTSSAVFYNPLTVSYSAPNSNVAAAFAGTPGTVGIQGPVDLDTLSVQTSGYSFTATTGSDSIVLDGPDPAAVNVPTSVSATFALPITTTWNTLVLSGGGTGYFSGTNTLSGAINVQNFTAVVTAPGTLADGTSLIVGNAAAFAQDTTTALAASASAVPYGQEVTFTATVAPNLSAVNPLTGQVEFYDGNQPLASVAVDGSGNAAFSTSSLAVGSHPITAAFHDGGYFNASTSAAVDEQVETTPVWTNGSDSLAPISVNVGQTCNLPAVTFHDSDAGSSHTARYVLGRRDRHRFRGGRSAHRPERPDPGPRRHDLRQLRVFGAGHVQRHDHPYRRRRLADLDRLAGNSGQRRRSTDELHALAGPKRIAGPIHCRGAQSAPFNIGIYASSDGTSPDQLLTPCAVGGADGSVTSELTVGSHTILIRADYADPQDNYHLIAVADGSSDADDTLEFAGGIFEAADPTQDPPQPYICVFGTASNGTGPGDTVTVEPGAIDFDKQTPFTLPNDTIPIHVRGEYGDNTLGADPSQMANVANPLWLFGGPGNNTLTGGSGGNTIVDGGGQNVVHCGNGGDNSPEIVDNSDTTAAFPGLTNNYAESGGGWTDDGDAAALQSAYDGDQRLGPAVAGSAAAWTFGGLTAAAYYDAYVTWSPEATASTQAQYSVADGAAQIEPIGQTSIATVDQTQPPLDDQADGVYWRDLGVFQCNSSTLKVSLASDSSGNALAGAVRLVRARLRRPRG